MEMELKKQNYSLVLAIIFSIGLLKLLIGLYLPLLADEAYWWMFSRNLDFSYYDQGPGVALHIRLFTSLFGETKLALKLAAVITTSLGNFLVYKIAKELGLSTNQALIALCLSILLPGFFLGSFVIVHDSSFIPLWIAAMYFALRFIKRRENYSLLGFFICLGLGALSKHTMIFFVFAALLWLLITPKEWKILKNPFLYLGLFLTAMVVSPILIWNYKHNWAGFEMVLGLHYAGGVNKSSSTILYIVGQLIAFSPLFYSAFWILPFKKGWKNFLEFWKDPAWCFTLINAWILPLSFLAISTKTSVQANWVFPSFPAMVVIISANLPDFSKKSKAIFWGIVACLPAVLFILFILFFHQIRGILKLDERMEFAHGNFGYKEAIVGIENFRESIDPNAGLLANTYQDAARASWYLPGKPYVPSLNVLKKNQFTFWEQPQAGKNYVVFHVSDYLCKKTDFLLFYLDYACDEVVEKPEAEIRQNGRFLKRYQVWYCKNLGEHWNKFFVNRRYDEVLKEIVSNLKEFDKLKAKHKVSQSTIMKLIADFNRDVCE
ncbi:MAG: glycosyltransferase family 39 protein [Leptospiraceae bacterium]|nr:glycosyltransferase family 39 protein [Leptospiraceae bacterium]